MKLTTGAPANLFVTTDVMGKPVNLEDYRGKHTLLSFFRSAQCPLCSLRVHYLIDRYPALQQRGLAVLAIFETSRETTIKYVGEQHPPFPLVANPEKDLYRLYGTETSWWGMISAFLLTRRREYREAAKFGWTKITDGKLNQLPADFVLGPDLTIERAYYGRDIGDHLPFSELERYLTDPAPALTRRR